MKEFKLGEYTYQISDGRELYYEIDSLSTEIRTKATKKFYEEYAQYKSINDVLENCLGMGNQLISASIAIAIEFLANQGIYDYEEMTFFDKHISKNYDWPQAIETVETEVQTIIDEYERNEDAIEYSRQTSGPSHYYSGGGFGVRGAVKGMAVAGVLNGIAGARARSKADKNARAASERNKEIAQEKLNRLFESNLGEQLCDRIDKIIASIRDELIDILNQNDPEYDSIYNTMPKCEFITQDDADAVKGIIRNFSRIPKEKRQEEGFRALNLKPNNIELFETLIDYDVFPTCELYRIACFFFNDNDKLEKKAVDKLIPQLSEQYLSDLKEMDEKSLINYNTEIGSKLLADGVFPAAITEFKRILCEQSGLVLLDSYKDIININEKERNIRGLRELKDSISIRNNLGLYSKVLDGIESSVDSSYNSIKEEYCKRISELIKNDKKTTDVDINDFINGIYSDDRITDDYSDMLKSSMVTIVDDYKEQKVEEYLNSVKNSVKEKNEKSIQGVIEDIESNTLLSTEKKNQIISLANDEIKCIHLLGESREFFKGESIDELFDFEKNYISSANSDIADDSVRETTLNFLNSLLVDEYNNRINEMVEKKDLSGLDEIKAVSHVDGVNVDAIKHEVEVGYIKSVIIQFTEGIKSDKHGVPFRSSNDKKHFFDLFNGIEEEKDYQSTKETLFYEEDICTPDKHRSTVLVILDNGIAFPCIHKKVDGDKLVMGLRLFSDFPTSPEKDCFGYDDKTKTICINNMPKGTSNILNNYNKDNAESIVFLLNTIIKIVNGELSRFDFWSEFNDHTLKQDSINAEQKAAYEKTAAYVVESTNHSELYNDTCVEYASWEDDFYLESVKGKRIELMEKCDGYMFKDDKLLLSLFRTNNEPRTCSVFESGICFGYEITSYSEEKRHVKSIRFSEISKVASSGKEIRIILKNGQTVSYKFGMMEFSKDGTQQVAAILNKLVEFDSKKNVSKKNNTKKTKDKSSHNTSNASTSKSASEVKPTITQSGGSQKKPESASAAESSVLDDESKSSDVFIGLQKKNKYVWSVTSRKDGDVFNVINPMMMATKDQITLMPHSSQEVMIYNEAGELIEKKGIIKEVNYGMPVMTICLESSSIGNIRDDAGLFLCVKSDKEFKGSVMDDFEKNYGIFSASEVVSVGSPQYQKKLQKLQKAGYAKKAFDNNEEIIIMHDSSVLGSMKEGFAISRSTFYSSGELGLPLPSSYDLASMKKIQVDPFNDDYLLSASVIKDGKYVGRSLSTWSDQAKLKLFAKILERLVYEASAYEISSENVDQFNQKSSIESAKEPIPVISTTEETESEPSSELVSATAEAPVTEEQTVDQVSKPEVSDGIPPSIANFYNEHSDIIVYTKGVSGFQKRVEKGQKQSWLKEAFSNNEQILMIIDSTVLGSMKEGLVLTDKAFYGKGILSIKERVSLTDIDSFEMIEGKKIYASLKSGDKVLVYHYYDAKKAEILMQTFERALKELVS